MVPYPLKFPFLVTNAFPAYRTVPGFILCVASHLRSCQLWTDCPTVPPCWIYHHISNRAHNVVLQQRNALLLSHHQDLRTALDVVLTLFGFFVLLASKVAVLPLIIFTYLKTGTLLIDYLD